MYNRKKYPAKYIRGQAYKVHYGKEIDWRNYQGWLQKKATAYNPGEVPYLKQLLQSYCEDALTFTIVFCDGHKCVYNKVSKKFEEVG